MLEPGFERLDHIRDPGGVFCLCLKGKIVYVGQSKNLYTRAGDAVVRARRPIRQSRWFTGGDFNGIPLFFDEVWVKFCGEAEASQLKADLIAKHRPEQQPPTIIKGLVIPHRWDRRVDLWALAKAAGVKLERTEKDSRRVR